MSVVLERAEINLPTKDREPGPAQIEELEVLFVYMCESLRGKKPIVAEIVPLKFKERDGLLTEKEKRRLAHLEGLENKFSRQISYAQEEVRKITNSDQAPWDFLDLAKERISE